MAAIGFFAQMERLIKLGAPAQHKRDHRQSPRTLSVEALFNKRD
jgi:hypothetical protein